MLRLAGLSLAVSLLSACGGGSDSNPDNGTIGFSGTITGLQGDITLAINGNQETFSDNGAFSASTRVTIDESYSVQVVDTEYDLTCTVSNGSGVAATNVTNIEISCNGEELTAYHLSELAFNVEEPSVVTFAFHLVDRFTGAAINTITNDNVEDFINVLENDLPISPTESFLEVEQLASVNADYHTVFAIDISSSLTNDQLQLILTAVKDVLVDDGGESKLLDDQYVSILTFDSEVETIVDKSQDITTIIDALEGIRVGGNSTNLYGAIKAATESWNNEISLDELSYGSLILFTDGRETSEKVSKQDALDASAGKDTYFIVIGDEADTEVLQEFTSSENIFSFADFADLEQAIGQALSQVQTFEQGLYVLSYATPKRAGNHELTISGVDDFRCDTSVTDEEAEQISNNGELTNCNDEVSYEFNADSFEDVSVELTLTGTTVTLLPTIEWQAKLRWSRETPSYQWTIDSCLGDIESTISEEGDTIEFERVSDSFSISYVSVQDTVTGQSKGSYLVMAPNTNSLANLNILTLDQICGN